MADLKHDNIRTLGTTQADAALEQRETGVYHTPYEAEAALYSCIERGDMEQLEQQLGAFMRGSIVVGRMSDSPERQLRYFAVCCITLATRSAIRGGLGEITAFNLSDEYIRHIDRMADVTQIPAYLSEKAVVLTRLVRESTPLLGCPDAVQRALYYIDAHLYEKLTARQIAEFCGLSPDYLGALVKRHTGRTIAQTVAQAKLREARRLKGRGLTNTAVAYQLGYCSESYFIACYRKEFGCTPGRGERVLL